MRFWNLTPHTMHYDDGQTQREFPSDGLLRIELAYQAAPSIDGMAIVTASYGEIVGLPDGIQPRDVLLVSTPVADNWPIEKRPPGIAVLVPDTGNSCRRDELGRIVSVARFIKK